MKMKYFATKFTSPSCNCLSLEVEITVFKENEKSDLQWHFIHRAEYFSQDN